MMHAFSKTVHIPLDVHAQYLLNIQKNYTLTAVHKNAVITVDCIFTNFDNFWNAI